MRYLLLIRHSHAIDPEAAGSDERRALSAYGRRQFTEIAASILGRGPAPESIFHSPLLRAVETAGLLHEAAGLPSSALREARWLAPGSSLQDVVTELNRDVADAIAVVSHEPMVSTWTSRLLQSGRLRFPPGSTAALEFDDQIAPGAGRLLWFLDSSEFG